MITQEALTHSNYASPNSLLRQCKNRTTSSNQSKPKTSLSMIKEPDDSDEECERELTNLNWLLRNQNLTWPKTMDENITVDEHVAISTREKTCNYRDKSNTVRQYQKHVEDGSMIKKLSAHPLALTPNKQQSTLSKRPTPAERYEIFINKIKRDREEYEKSAYSFETDVTEKPPFNYSHIIGMAMLENGRVTLQQICSWIESKFAFFRVRKKWNNSIRHNLSLHYCFRKIDRKREEKGKGGYWELGVDPKKCDRKRIRNRKTVQSNAMNSQHPLLKSTGYDNSQNTQHDENANNNVSMLPSISIPINENIQICYKTNSSQQSLTLTDVGLASMINSQAGHCSNNLLCSQEYPTNQEIFGDQSQQYELGTIIISTTGIIDNETVNAVDVISEKFDYPGVIFTEDDVPKATENITISSEITAISTTSKQIKMEDANKSTNEPLMSSTVGSLNILNGIETEPFPVSAGNLTINCDYSNFRPYMDGIEESFHYLNSTEINRNEDILDNLLDVCVSDY